MVVVVAVCSMFPGCVGAGPKTKEPVLAAVVAGGDAITVLKEGSELPNNKELPSLLPKTGVFDESEALAAPNMFLLLSKVNVVVLNTGAVVVCPNTGCPVALGEIAVCVVGTLKGLQMLTLSSELLVAVAVGFSAVSLRLNCGFMPKEKVVVFLSLNSFKSPVPKLIVELSKIFVPGVVLVDVIAKENPLFMDVG